MKGRHEGVNNVALRWQGPSADSFQNFMMLSSVHEPEKAAQKHFKERPGRLEEDEGRVGNHKADFCWNLEKSEDIFPARLPLSFVNFALQFLNNPDVTFQVQ